MNKIFKQIIVNNFFIKAIKPRPFFVVERYSQLSLCTYTDNAPDNSVLSKNDEEFKVGRKVAQEKLTEMLQIKEITALEIITTYKRFCEIPCTLMTKNYELCEINKLQKNLVLKHPYILT